MVACLLVACSKDDGVNTDEPEVRLELLVDTVSFKVNGSFYFTEDLVRIDDRRTGAMAGMVMAVAEGEAVVTVESVGGLKAECRVKVLPPVIELSETEMEMYVDETYTLSVTVLPDIDKYRDVTWSSSDETVATVSTTGMVMAISAGEAVITAASVGGLKAECRVTVKNVPVSSVSIPELSEGMGLVAGDELQLTYEVLPENAFNPNRSLGFPSVVWQ